jgi:hypothetical protein
MLGVKLTGFLWCVHISLKNIGERLHWDWLISFSYKVKKAACRGKVK